ncbi:MAG: hypothetical protein JSS29_19000 [Proteobacteria bacterium]|nr:hypothetical protein [Pseudomonadota bacterium]
MFRLIGLAVAVSTLALSACDNGDSVGGGSSLNKVNGSVRVAPGDHADGIGTVNGDVTVGDNAVVGDVHTVNGPIEIGSHVSVDAVKAVNGPVTIGSATKVAHGITTVNGTVNLKEAEVAGAVKNVNGHIVLDGAHVAGGIQTVEADIDLKGGAHLEGGIWVEKSSGWVNVGKHKPRIVIGPGSTVQGDLRFDHEVDLYVSDKATIGPVSGATAIPFTGDQPPG